MSLEQLGPYKIERELGQGGMGTVYAAVHTETGQPAAIKVLSQLMSERGNYRVRFGAEIETLKKLRHPNIVQLFGYGEQDGHLFYAMEIVDGRSLHDELRAGRVFSWREVTGYGLQICAALKHAHDSGVIHRDLKPANLLLTSDQRVKLSDFGIAKLFGGSQLTAIGGVVGTADYMSPEQADGKPISHRCDLYSLGSVLYALLARRPPFTGKSLAQVVHSLRYDPPVPVRRLAPNTPPELEELLSELLNKDAQQRPSTALLVANRLKAIEAAIGDENNTKSASDDDYRLRDEGSGGLTHGMSGTQIAADARGPDQSDAWKNPTRATPSKERKSIKTKASGTSTGPSSGASAISRFTTLADDELRRATDDSNADPSRLPDWIKGLGIGVAFVSVAAAVWFATRPPTAASLYSKIHAIAADGDVERMREVESEMLDFIHRFPDDPRLVEVQGYQDDIDADRRARRFERPTRRMRDDAKLPAIDRAYLEATLLAASDPDEATTRFQAIIDLFASNRSPPDDATAKTVELARAELKRLESLASSQQQFHLATLHERLQWAEEHYPTNSAGAILVCDALIRLYQSKPWAREAVQRAEQLREKWIER